MFRDVHSGSAGGLWFAGGGIAPALRGGAMSVFCAASLLSVAIAARSIAHAQSTESDVQAAARAFEEAQRAQLRGDSADAARLYELADSLAPTPEALRSAIRSQVAAGHEPRAATLALAAQSRYPEDAESSALARDVLAQLSGKLARVSVQCDAPCALLCDGRAVVTEPAAQLDFFVEPGVHVIEARFAQQRAVQKSAQADAGARIDLRFAEPAWSRPPVAAPAADDARAVASPRAAASQHAEASSAGLPSWLFWTATGATLAASTAALISGLDMREKRDAYQAAPTRAGYESGKDSERRTNALLVASGALLVSSVCLGFFTDWDGEETISPSVAASRDGATLVLTRSFQ